MSSWIQEAEAALTSRKLSPNSESDIEIVDAHAPALLDASGARALMSPFLAGFMWAAVVFRETQTHSTLDPLALLLRVLALSMTLRAVGVLWSFARKLRLLLQHRRYGLVLTDEGVLFRAPDRDVVVPISDVLDIREQEAASLSARASSSGAEVYLVTHPNSARTHVALPPLFAASPRALAERLMRWRGMGPAATPLPAASAEPLSLPSKLWERIASG